MLIRRNPSPRHWNFGQRLGAVGVLGVLLVLSACISSRDFDPFTWRFDLPAAERTSKASLAIVGPFQTMPGQCTGPYHVQRQDSAGKEAASSLPLSVALRTSEKAGFYEDPTCTQSIPSVSLKKGKSKAQFYFVDADPKGTSRMIIEVSNIETLRASLVSRRDISHRAGVTRSDGYRVKE